ncbi:MAG: LiaI-LiaF-like domain-containing protein [Candidatus Kryptonium sp.]
MPSNTQKNGKTGLIFGIILIIVGLIILLNKLGALHLNLKKIISTILVVYGAYLGYSGFGLNSNRKVFWGSIFFFFGIYLFIDSFELLNPEIHFFWPVVLIVTGLSFLMSFVNRPKDYALLLPAVMLIGIGTLFLLTDIGVIYSFEFWENFEKFWPVLLIILGLYFILKKR